MADFLWRALLAGIGVALVAGPLGSFVVWRRMSYFGDTLAHSALLGIALGIALDANLNLAVIVSCTLLACLLVALQQRKIISTDTLLGILAHSSLSLGLIAVSLLEVRVDLLGYLFGDLLTVTGQELMWIYIGVGLILSLLLAFWRPLLAITVDEDLAQAEGYPVLWIRLLLMLLIAIVIAVAMKIVGVLLITALMVIPAATSRRLTNSPESMAALSSLVGCGAVVIGLFSSLQWDTPTGPSIVVGATSLFLLVYALPLKGRREIK
ncbi:MAG: iron chelate uptake ABC transporter family permease subunit [Pseudomonadales bacterium]